MDVDRRDFPVDRRLIVLTRVGFHPPEPDHVRLVSCDEKVGLFGFDRIVVRIAVVSPRRYLLVGVVLTPEPANRREVNVADLPGVAGYRLTNGRFHSVVDY